MVFPKSTGRTGGRLLPPASSVNDIDPAVFVDVAATQAVPAPYGRCGNSMEGPHPGRVGSRLEVPPRDPRCEPGFLLRAWVDEREQLGLSVSIDIRERNCLRRGII